MSTQRPMVTPRGPMGGMFGGPPAKSKDFKGTSKAFIKGDRRRAQNSCRSSFVDQFERHYWCLWAENFGSSNK